jgi:hypothetical protein
VRAYVFRFRSDERVARRPHCRHRTVFAYALRTLRPRGRPGTSKAIAYRITIVDYYCLLYRIVAFFWRRLLFVLCFYVAPYGSFNVP